MLELGSLALPGVVDGTAEVVEALLFVREPEEETAELVVEILLDDEGCTLDDEGCTLDEAAIVVVVVVEEGTALLEAGIEGCKVDTVVVVVGTEEIGGGLVVVAAVVVVTTGDATSVVVTATVVVVAVFVAVIASAEDSALDKGSLTDGKT